MAKITMSDCTIDADALKHSLTKAFDAVSISAKAAGKIIGEWTTTSSSIPVDYTWATTTGGTTIAYGKETQSQEIVDLETKIEDAIDNIVMLIQAAKPHDEESLRDRIRSGIEEAFRVDEKPESKSIETISWDTPFEPTIVDDAAKEYKKEITKEVEKDFRKEMMKSYISSNPLEQPP